MHNEAFLQDNTWIDVLKPRFSYGVTGNINSNYTSYLTARISVHEDTGDKYATINTPPNDQLRWEKTKTLNVGVDFSFLNFRINGSLDYYDKRGSDILSLVDTDPTTGWASLNMNNANTRNRGFELQLNGDILRATQPEQVGISAEIALAYNNNKVTKINHIATSGYNALKSSDYKEGYPVNSIYSYVWDGIRYDDEGYQHIYWKKADGSSNYDGLTSKTFEPADVVFSGSLDPKWSGSFTRPSLIKAVVTSISSAFCPVPSIQTDAMRCRDISMPVQNPYLSLVSGMVHNEVTRFTPGQTSGIKFIPDPSLCRLSHPMRVGETVVVTGKFNTVSSCAGVR